MLHTKNQQQIRIRLTSPSNAMGYDPRYIYHFYDIMEKFAASRNDTGSVINYDLTFSEDRHGSLVFIVSRNSSILISVDSNYMVKNLCISQKYISWSYF